MKKYYESVKIADGVYRILANGNHCCELLVGSRMAALVDTGLGLGDLARAVREVTDLPLIILNTHCHVDHAGGNTLFDAPAYMGQEDIETFDYSCSRDFRIITLQRNKNVLEWLREDGFDPEEYVNRPRGELRPCSEGDVFDLGGLTVRVFNTPGHSVGGRSFYLEQMRYLYTGDAVYPCTLLFGYGSAKREVHIATLEKMLSIPFDRIYGNHMAKPMMRQDVELYLRAAREVRYEDGYPFPNPIRDGEDARTCCLDGMKPEDEGKEGFAALILSSYT